MQLYILLFRASFTKELLCTDSEAPARDTFEICIGASKFLFFDLFSSPFFSCFERVPQFAIHRWATFDNKLESIHRLFFLAS